MVKQEVLETRIHFVAKMWLKCFIMVITICSAYAMVPHKRQAPPADLQCPEPKLKEDFEPEKVNYISISFTLNSEYSIY